MRLVMIPVVSRCCSALCVITLRPIGHSQYAGIEATPDERITLLVIWALSMIACAVWLGRGVIVPAVETVAYALSMFLAVRALEGVSGDVAGFALSVSECLALMALALL